MVCCAALRVNETKLTSQNAFIADLFALGDEKESKYKKGPSFGAPCRVLICLLTFSFGNTQICVFLDYFSFGKFFFGYFLLLLEVNTKLIKFCTKFHLTQANFMPFKCTSLLLCRNCLPPKLPAFFQKI